MDYGFKPRLPQSHPADFAKEMLNRKSELFINPKECEPINSEVVGDNTFIAHLPDETQVVFQMIHVSPISLVTWNFFRQKIHGRTLPWLNGQSIYFPEIDQYKPASIIPIHNPDKDSSPRDGVEIIFRRSRNGTTRLRVWGLTEIPLIIGGIPLRISFLVVDMLPMHRTSNSGPIPDLLLTGPLFNGVTIPLEYTWGPKTIRCKPGNAVINTRIMPDTGNIALEVYADVANPRPHKRGIIYEFGYGVWFGDDCVFNKCGTMDFDKPQADFVLQLRGTLQAMYAIRDISIYCYSAFDFTDVVFYCSSRHVVDWADEWVAHGGNTLWVKKLKMEQRAKDLWVEMTHAMKAANKTFHFLFIEPNHNEEAATLAQIAVKRLPRPTFLLTNEPHTIRKVKDLTKPKQRLCNHFQGMSLEGGMCRKRHPRGFKIDLCCICTKQDKPWEQHFHY
ncbi:hypothetical protein TWF730_008218 [Orbilia blumenaviensis]|uniref:RNase H type-1 domain-containing protein n=1 Tax=Orbilia blumenaviensis TaxID=1796055 RepID=A0AAV9V4D9_9PEZI